jgi:hypothetical protein
MVVKKGGLNKALLVSFSKLVVFCLLLFSLTFSVMASVDTYILADYGPYTAVSVNVCYGSTTCEWDVGNFDFPSDSYCGYSGDVYIYSYVYNTDTGDDAYSEKILVYTIDWNNKESHCACFLGSEHWIENGEDSFCCGVNEYEYLVTIGAGAPACASEPGQCVFENGTFQNYSVEICDGKDNDCSGVIDEGCDDDKDGYADINMYCDGHFFDGLGVLRSCDDYWGDCDDNLLNDPDVCWFGISIEDRNLSSYELIFEDINCSDYIYSNCSKCINPGATTYCDGIDNDCSGSIDFGCPCTVGELRFCNLQLGVCAGTEQLCDQFGFWGACDYGAFHEPIELTCDYLDNNCDGLVDEGFDGINNSMWRTYYLDKDGDGFGVFEVNWTGCPGYQPEGYVLNSNDCNDNPLDDPDVCWFGFDKTWDNYNDYVKSLIDCTDVTYSVCAKCINPGAEEICGDGVDNDCSGFIDDKNCGLIESSTLIIEECGLGSYDNSSIKNLVSMNSVVCPALDFFKVNSCAGTPIYNMINLNFSTRFHSPEQNNAYCQVLIIEQGSDGLEEVSLNNEILDLAHVEIVGDPECYDRKSYFKGVVDLNSGSLEDAEVIDVLAGNNILDVDVSSAKIKNIIIKCSDVVGLDSELFYENLFYEPMSPVNINFAISEISDDYGLDFYQDFNFKIEFDDGNVQILHTPNFCDGENFGDFFLLTCKPDVSEFEIQVAFSESGSQEIKTLLRYNNFTNIRSVQKDYSILIGDKITTDEYTEDKYVQFVLSDGRIVEFTDLRYGDTIRRMDVSCGADYLNAEVLIRNVNRQYSCPYFSNDLRGDGIIYFNLRNPDITIPRARGCEYPFTINRSGLYELEVSCFGNKSDPGVCYNPLPVILPNNFIGWDLYWRLGKFIFSFFGDNSIPDYVCNSAGRLKPISLFDEPVQINIGAQQEDAPIVIEIIDPVGSKDIVKGDFYDFKVEVTCNKPEGCSNMEVSLIHE